MTEPRMPTPYVAFRDRLGPALESIFACWSRHVVVRVGRGEKEVRARARRRERRIVSTPNALTMNDSAPPPNTHTHDTEKRTLRPLRTAAAIFSHIKGKFNSMKVWQIWSRTSDVGTSAVGAARPDRVKRERVKRGRGYEFLDAVAVCVCV